MTSRRESFSFFMSAIWRLVSVLAFIILIGSCRGPKALVLPTNELTIDGKLDDWANIASLSLPTDPILLKVAKDAEFVYVYVRFADRRSFEDAQQYGFTMYFEDSKKFKRQFGITYPTGILNELAMFPGARKSYLEDPYWSTKPANKRMLEQIQVEMFERAMIVNRNHKKDKVRRLPMNLLQLGAQDIAIASDQSGQTMALEMRVPIKTNRKRQFGIDPVPGKPIRIGFEVQPPDVDEMMTEQQGLNPMLGGMDRVGRNAAGPQQRQMMLGQDQNVQLRQLMLLKMGAFSKWFTIQNK